VAPPPDVRLVSDLPLVITHNFDFRVNTGSESCCPGGTSENSPAIHCWDARRLTAMSAVGTAEAVVITHGQPSLRDCDDSLAPDPSNELLGYYHPSLTGRKTRRKCG
jgi:hypothetical protein